MGVVIAALVTALMIYSHQGQVGDELVVVLPGPDGKVGTVVVERNCERAVLSQPFAASRNPAALRPPPGAVPGERCR